MLTHRNLVANMLQVEAWNQPMVNVPPRTDHLIVVTALPLYHIFALTACFLFGVRIRRHVHPHHQIRAISPASSRSFVITR